MSNGQPGHPTRSQAGLYAVSGWEYWRIASVRRLSGKLGIVIELPRDQEFVLTRLMAD